MDFLRSISHEESVGGTVTCRPEASLGNVIDLLALKWVHRVYVVEEEELIGLVTLRDVISCFIFEPIEHFDDSFGIALKELQSRGQS